MEWIDKPVYSAAMFAKKMITEHRVWGDAYQRAIYINTAARYYHVDKEDVKSALGKIVNHNRKPSAPRKYRYYVVRRTTEQRERWNESDLYEVKKAISKENATKSMTMYAADCEYDTDIWFEYIADFATKDEADAYAEKHNHEVYEQIKQMQRGN